MTAEGIHVDPNHRLGLRRPRRGQPRLKLRDFLTGAKVPPHPASADYLKGLSFGLYANDRFGVCGPVSLANYIRLVTAKLSGKMEVPDQNAVYDLYRRSGNPNFSPVTGDDDNGVRMQTMLAAAVKGGMGGHKVLGFAEVDVSNLDELDAAVGICGGILIGVDLDLAQQAQTNAGIWDYVSGSGSWGGHAVLDGAYLATDGHRVITWAKAVTMTDNFARHQESEAWVAILPEHLGSKAFIDGMDVAAFAKAYEDMTGKKFPAPLPPTPIPGTYTRTITFSGVGVPPTIVVN